jgi:hypothetical protein
MLIQLFSMESPSGEHSDIDIWGSILVEKKGMCPYYVCII